MYFSSKRDFLVPLWRSYEMFWYMKKVWIPLKWFASKSGIVHQIVHNENEAYFSFKGEFDSFRCGEVNGNTRRVDNFEWIYCTYGLSPVTSLHQQWLRAHQADSGVRIYLEKGMNGEL